MQGAACVAFVWIWNTASSRYTYTHVTHSVACVSKFALKIGLRIIYCENTNWSWYSASLSLYKAYSRVEIYDFRWENTRARGPTNYYSLVSHDEHSLTFSFKTHTLVYGERHATAHVKYPNSVTEEHCAGGSQRAHRADCRRWLHYASGFVLNASTTWILCSHFAQSSRGFFFLPRIVHSTIGRSNAVYYIKHN